MPKKGHSALQPHSKKQPPPPPNRASMELYPGTQSMRKHENWITLVGNVQTICKTVYNCTYLNSKAPQFLGKPMN